jgi:hypothetical protein
MISNAPVSGAIDFSKPSGPVVVGKVTSVLTIQYGDAFLSREVVADEYEDFLSAIQRVANDLFQEIRQEAQVTAG